MFELNNMPLWLFALDVIVLTSIFYLAGYLQGKRASAKEESEGPVGSMVAAVLALLAFMLAFTFGLATGRYDERRLLVLDEANAIGTTYIRADFLDEADKGKMRKLLRTYTETRIHMYDDPGGVDGAIKKSTELQNAMWSIAADLGKKHPTPVSALFISSLNDTIDLQEKREKRLFRGPVNKSFAPVPIPLTIGAATKQFQQMPGSAKWPLSPRLVARLLMLRRAFRRPT